MYKAQRNKLNREGNNGRGEWRIGLHDPDYLSARPSVLIYTRYIRAHWVPAPSKLRLPLRAVVV